MHRVKHFMRGFLPFLVFGLLILFNPIPIAFPREPQITLTGRAFIPVVTESGKITERFFAFAPIEVVDFRTKQVVAEGETKANGSYTLVVKNPGMYLLRIGGGNRIVLDISPEIKEKRTYDLSFAGARSTALVLVLLKLSQGKKNPESVVTYKTGRVLRAEKFRDLENLVRKTLAFGESVFESREIQELVETITASL